MVQTVRVITERYRLISRTLYIHDLFTNNLLATYLEPINKHMSLMISPTFLTDSKTNCEERESRHPKSITISNFEKNYTTKFYNHCEISGKIYYFIGTSSPH